MRVRCCLFVLCPLGRGTFLKPTSGDTPISSTREAPFVRIVVWSITHVGSWLCIGEQSKHASVVLFDEIIEADLQEKAQAAHISKYRRGIHYIEKPMFLSEDQLVGNLQLSCDPDIPLPGYPYVTVFLPAIVMPTYLLPPPLGPLGVNNFM